MRPAGGDSHRTTNRCSWKLAQWPRIRTNAPQHSEDKVGTQMREQAGKSLSAETGHSTVNPETQGSPCRRKGPRCCCNANAAMHSGCWETRFERSGSGCNFQDQAAKSTRTETRDASTCSEARPPVWSQSYSISPRLYMRTMIRALPRSSLPWMLGSYIMITGNTGLA